MPLDVVHAGYLPLLDSASLVVAVRLGFAERYGLDLKLHRERSWATVRDRMSVGHFDCAQMPAPLPIAMSLSLGPLNTETFAPMVLNTGGNAVTVGNEVAAALKDEAPTDQSPAAIGAALRFAVARLSERKGRQIRFAVVHRFSCHNYDLRYWLAACGIRPDTDVEITVVPPSLMPEALSSGQIDGFSAGEPWNTIAVRNGAGAIVATKAEIAPNSPEKVLGTSRAFVDDRRDVCERLIKCLLEAGQWCDALENRPALAELMAEARHVAVDETHLMPGLTGELETAPGERRIVGSFLSFSCQGNRPDAGYARWLYRQMMRWGHGRADPTAASIVEKVYQPSVFGTATSADQAPSAGPTATFEPLRFSLFDDGRSNLLSK
ncbi:nitrate transporter component, nrtA [Fulvimarina pelagi HTCC2506]|uniref:Nitrate transporter component, nrtA n=1 Tax=Fulvimarina pelagi HTCC2506 TaxID=314231 RepID=Q0G446_9HYPH|nr:CmpA/NrtA family ABC transporter substrate-binding protein [Fulvimarina pelagi]EAU41635.1 nitrate transporter component, nrtA [Fulvimarina pelagi HTCC2506]